MPGNGRGVIILVKLVATAMKFKEKYFGEQIVLTRSFLALPDLISRAWDVREAGSTDLVRAPRVPGS